MKSRIFIFSFCLILVFSFSVHAVPDNVFDTSFQLTYQLSTGTASLPQYTFQSGNLISYGFWSPTSDNYVSLINYSGTVPFTYDLYIAVLTSNLPYVQFEVIDDYYYPAGNLSESISITSGLMNYSNGSFVANNPFTVNTTEDITFCYFRDVPAGTTFLVNDVNPYPPQGISYINAYSNLAHANVNFTQFAFGCYFGYAKVTGDDIINQYQDGQISLSDAIDSINSIVNDSISSTTDYTQSTLNLLIGQSQIDELLRLSDDKSLNNLNSTLIPSFDRAIDSYVSGTSTIDQTLVSLNDTLQSGLASSDTVEQGTLVNTTYQLKLEELQIQAQLKSKSVLDSAISDSEVSEFDYYYSSEAELMDKFNIADFKSQIDFDTWMLQLPTQEAIEYKKFFDYILNESPFRFFIVVPMSCGLIALVLGTRIRLSHNSSSKSGGD